MAQSEVADAPVRNIKRSKLMAKPIGIGKAAPTPIISNKDMEDIVETTDVSAASLCAWILSRRQHALAREHCSLLSCVSAGVDHDADWHRVPPLP